MAEYYSGDLTDAQNPETSKMTDPISDFLTHLRNARKARLEECHSPHSTLKFGLAAILKAESVDQVALIGSPNQVEAVMANMAKRPPVFSDI